LNEVLIRFTVTSFQIIIKYRILSISQLCKIYVFRRKKHFPVIYSTHHSERIRNLTIAADRGPPYESFFFQCSLGIKVYIYTFGRSVL